MQKNTENTWRCSICGYIHYGIETPELCPICEAKATDFKEIQVVVRPERRDAGKERVVIIGAGVAGVSAAEAVRIYAPHAEIILISKEEAFPYICA